MGLALWLALPWVAADPFLALGFALTCGAVLGLVFVLGPFATWIEDLADSLFMPSGGAPDEQSSQRKARSKAQPDGAPGGTRAQGPGKQGRGPPN